ncbi:MAG: MFS transporter [Acetobacter sp.]|nr:MFS transporter [Bacteroides sp.]MCM1341507.1 MFS transporter [Acetobacter sp.]MCM1433705.1 MFS transporter [Clostridiales bacterium]
MGERAVRTYDKKELRGYLVGMFGQNMIYNIIATGLVSTYLQFYLKIPVAAIGVIVAISRVWDAVNDPMMGTIVDRTRTKWGKCRPYLIIFPAIIGAITILCFVNGIYTEATTSLQRGLIIGWAAVAYIIWGMCFTVCDIPLWGITSLMTEKESDRSKILGLARIAAGIGGIGVLVVQIGQVLGGIFTNGLDPVKDVKAYNAGNQKGFILAVVVLTVISTVLFEFAGISTREKVQVNEKKYTFKENFKIMWKCKPFRQILISGILRSPIQLLMLIAMPFVTYYFADGDITNIWSKGINFGMLINIGIIAIGIFAGQFVAMGITPALSRKFENKTLYNFFSIAGAVPFALLFVVYKIAGGDVTPIGWIILTGLMLMLASAGMGGINVMQSVMIADCVDYEEYHNGIRPDGVFFSGQSFITKLSGGIAAIIQSVAYGYVNFSDTAIEKMQASLATGQQSFIDYNGGKFAAVMFFLISIPPAIGMLLSALPTLKYSLSDKEHKRILDELVAKRAGE